MYTYNILKMSLTIANKKTLNFAKKMGDDDATIERLKNIMIEENKILKEEAKEKAKITREAKKNVKARIEKNGRDFFNENISQCYFCKGTGLGCKYILPNNIRVCGSCLHGKCKNKNS